MVAWHIRQLDKNIGNPTLPESLPQYAAINSARENQYQISYMIASIHNAK